jgi:dihydroorotase-like cyclic amidohydrolase
MLSHTTSPPLATVSWWHLVQDRSNQTAEATHWFVTPSIGGQTDRQALIQALGEGTINAVAVHGIPLDDEECLLPPDQRPKGISGHHFSAANALATPRGRFGMEREPAVASAQFRSGTVAWTERRTTQHRKQPLVAL